jgi:aerobic-type carbon monoxide dehydrogenase small subunit (CoxS/CutS family)
MELYQTAQFQPICQTIQLITGRNASQRQDAGAKISAASRSPHDAVLSKTRKIKTRKIETGESAMSEIPELKTTDGASSRITRRKFILGVIASGGVVAAANYRLISSAVHGQMTSADRLITIDVNGMQRRVDVMKNERLAWTLRYKLGLTGTKLGCDRAECGACTVLLDDVPHYSCSVLTHTVRGKKVTTIEGLASADGKLHPVQQAVVDKQGFQCAFCMSGFIMSAVGFLKTNPNPTRTELAHGISGNLCRCQDYNKILDSMMQGAENMRRA